MEFKQYNSSNPAKYGLLHPSLCDAVVSHTYYSFFYAGKPEMYDKGNKVSKFSVPGTDKYIKYLANSFSAVSEMSGCNISMNKHFTYIPMAQWAA